MPPCSTWVSPSSWGCCDNFTCDFSLPCGHRGSRVGFCFVLVDALGVVKRLDEGLREMLARLARFWTEALFTPLSPWTGGLDSWLGKCQLNSCFPLGPAPLPDAVLEALKDVK